MTCLHCSAQTEGASSFCSDTHRASYHRARNAEIARKAKECPLCTPTAENAARHLGDLAVPGVCLRLSCRCGAVEEIEVRTCFDKMDARAGVEEWFREHGGCPTPPAGSSPASGE